MNRLRLLAFPASAVLLIIAQPPAGDEPRDADKAAAATIKAADLKKDLSYIASDELEGRATGSQGQWLAGEFLAKRFEELKLEKGGDGDSYHQKVDFTPRKKKKDADDAPASGPAAKPTTKPAPVEVSNVVGILRGTDASLGAIVFSAHYDHLGRGRADEKGDTIYNGADDDGSGTVSVLALAKAYSSRRDKPKRTIVFACFTGEEIGGLGSKAYVTTPKVPLEKTLCDINLEMMGRSFGIGEKRAWVTGWDVTTLGPILAKGGKAAGIEIYPDPYPEQMYYYRSDNMAFVSKNVIGQTVSAGSNHPQYHKPSDEVGLIEFDNLEAIVRAVYFGSARIADGQDEPKLTGDSLELKAAPRKKKPESAPAK
ncbi:MAG: M20/M25/M40 family metallo-hydrolase [Planctomycetes bacterium]|nr:M20/M25/M40 family metallo-hydrolase [Planctomycetota bacterium]